eukprot:scaffold21337_cov129-Isochrysis_galbana.AAC.1
MRAGGDEVEEGAPLGVLHGLQLVDQQLVHLGMLAVPAGGVDVPRQLRLGPVDAHGAAQRRLQLPQREDGQAREGGHLVEALAPCGGLCEHAVRQPELRHEVHVFWQGVHVELALVAPLHQRRARDGA